MNVTWARVIFVCREFISLANGAATLMQFMTRVALPRPAI